jgi:pimeloyl-ACP methyl ester carboxylesterase
LGIGFAFAILAVPAQAAAAPQVSVFDSLAQIRPDKALPAGAGSQANIAAAGNEFESFQVAVDASSGAVSGLDAFADRIAAVIVEEGAAPAPLVGHSLGGLVALRVALRRPELVSSLVLAGSAGLSIGKPLLRELLTAFTVIRPGRLAGRYRTLVARSPLLRRFVFGFVSVADPVGLTDIAVEGFLAGQLLHTDTASAWRALQEDDPRQELGRLAVPVLVLWGAEDAQLPLEDAFEYARRLRAPLRTIAGCGHLLIGERPAACAHAIEEFIAAGGSGSAEPASGADTS